MSTTAARAAVDRIRREQHRRGWTQAELAQRTGVSLTTVSRILNARDYTTPRSIAKIEAALGLGEFAAARDDDHPRSWAEVLDDAPASELAAAIVRRLGAAQHVVDHAGPAAEAVPPEVFGEPGTFLPPRQEAAPVAGNG